MTKWQKTPSQHQETMPPADSRARDCSNESGNTSDDNKTNEGRHYNTIIGISHDTSFGPRYRIGPLVTGADIIDFAQEECRRSGGSLAELAGIEWKESEAGYLFAPREWEPGEEFYTAIAKLNDEGRVYEIYDCEAEVDAFLDRAEQQGIGDDAPRKRGK